MTPSLTRSLRVVSALVYFLLSVVLLSRPRSGRGGSVWESNPPNPPEAGRNDFEDRRNHQAPSAPVKSSDHDRVRPRDLD